MAGKGANGGERDKERSACNFRFLGSLNFPISQENMCEGDGGNNKSRYLKINLSNSLRNVNKILVYLKRTRAAGICISSYILLALQRR